MPKENKKNTLSILCWDMQSCALQQVTCLLFYVSDQQTKHGLAMPGSASCRPSFDAGYPHTFAQNDGLCKHFVQTCKSFTDCQNAYQCALHKTCCRFFPQKKKKKTMWRKGKLKRKLASQQFWPNNFIICEVEHVSECLQVCVCVCVWECIRVCVSVCV